MQTSSASSSGHDCGKPTLLQVIAGREPPKPAQSSHNPIPKTQQIRPPGAAAESWDLLLPIPWGFCSPASPPVAHCPIEPVSPHHHFSESFKHAIAFAVLSVQLQLKSFSNTEVLCRIQAAAGVLRASEPLGRVRHTHLHRSSVRKLAASLAFCAIRHMQAPPACAGWRPCRVEAKC